MSDICTNNWKFDVYNVLYQAYHLIYDWHTQLTSIQPRIGSLSFSQMNPQVSWENEELYMSNQVEI